MPEPRTFPDAIEQLFATAGLWAVFTPEARTLLQGLGVKLEPFCVPLNADPGNNDLRGFEMLALGRGGAHYEALKAKAKQAGLSVGLLGVALFQVARLTAEALVQEMKEKTTQQVIANLHFSVNVDAAMLAEPLFARVLDQGSRPPFHLLLEASEDLQTKDAEPLLTLLAVHGWLELALDDSDKLSKATRALLTNRVKLVKADGVYVRRLFKDELVQPGEMLPALLKLHQPGKPFVAEGVENQDIKSFLKENWDVSAHGELWMQGWCGRPPAPWEGVLVPLNADPVLPKAYLLPENRSASSKEEDIPPDTPPPRQPDSEFIRQVRSNILELLDQNPLLDGAGAGALRKLDDPNSPEAQRWFAKPHLMLDEVLHEAARKCLQAQRAPGTAAFDALWNAAKELLGNVCLLAVDEALVNKAEADGRTAALEFEFVAVFDTSVEILHARLRQHLPRFREADDVATPDGSNRIELKPELEQGGWNEKANLDALLAEIWARVNAKPTLPPGFRLTADDSTAKSYRQLLDGNLKRFSAQLGKHYYLRVNKDLPGALTKESAQAIKKFLPHLPILFFRPPGANELPALRDEADLVSGICTFLSIPSSLAASS